MWLSCLSLKNHPGQRAEPHTVSDGEASSPSAYTGAVELEIMRVTESAPHLGLLFALNWHNSAKQRWVGQSA